MRCEFQNIIFVCEMFTKYVNLYVLDVKLEC